MFCSEQFILIHFILANWFFELTQYVKQWILIEFSLNVTGNSVSKFGNLINR